MLEGWGPVLEELLLPAVEEGGRQVALISSPAKAATVSQRRSSLDIIRSPIGNAYSHGLRMTFAVSCEAQSSIASCTWLMGSTWLISRPTSGDSWMTFKIRG